MLGAEAAANACIDVDGVISILLGFAKTNKRIFSALFRAKRAAYALTLINAERLLALALDSLHGTESRAKRAADALTLINAVNAWSNWIGDNRNPRMNSVFRTGFNTDKTINAPSLNNGESVRTSNDCIHGATPLAFPAGNAILGLYVLGHGLRLSYLFVHVRIIEALEGLRDIVQTKAP